VTQEHRKLAAVAAAEVGGAIGALKNDEDVLFLIGSSRTNGNEKKEKEEKQRMGTGSPHVAKIKLPYSRFINKHAGSLKNPRGNGK
jgi:hypothetical protein